MRKITALKEIKVLVIVQARMASSRLPGKTLLKLDGKPLIQHTLMQAAKAKNVDEVILATSSKPDNDPLESLCKSIGFDCFRGSEDDVLKRFIDASKKYNPDLIVRICGDEPLFDVRVLEEAIEKHKAAKVDYSTTVGRVPKGLDVEVINYDTLKLVDAKAKEQVYREHVTNYILKNPDDFKILVLDFGDELARHDIVLTVDTRYDFDFIKEIYFSLKKAKKLGSKILAEHIITLVDSGKVKRKPILLLRADGSSQKGMGDLVSVMNIARPLMNDYELIFASRNHPEAVGFIKSKGFEVFMLPLGINQKEEIEKIMAFCSQRNIKHCIIELVPNDEDYVKELSSFLKTLMVDFFGGIKASSDILLNWDLGAEQLKYTFIGNNTLKMFGPDYVPLPEKILLKAKKSQNNKLSNITVSFGGSDPIGMTSKIIEIVRSVSSNYDFTFVIGPAFNGRDVLEKKIRQAGMKFVIAPDNNSLDQLFAKSDLVICSGGLTAFELCALKVPFIGISSIEWEAKRLKNLDKIGACCFISPEDKPEFGKKVLYSIKELTSKQARKNMALKQAKLVDGKGSKRIADAVRKRWAI